ncbi:DUF5682 family protein, partial [Streptomyces sp. NPDC046203]|uniref:DUF5682 family protein n=1 Tax=Streptomyces sp. NPDC046203 TaxID=3154602 RepID=UPI0033E8B0B6
AQARAVAAGDLAAVTALAEQCLLAGLTGALPAVLRALADRAALDADVSHLAQALPALARSLRYGDVRATDTTALAEVAAGLAERICVGLPPACVGLDADAAAEMRGRLDAVHAAIALLPPERVGGEGQGSAEPDGTDDGSGTDAPDTPGTPDGIAGRWAGVLGRLAVRERVPGTVRGRAARLLLDEGRLADDEAARLMGLALSPAAPPADAAAWIEGFAGGASGGGLLLVHDERLLALVDGWLSGVPDDAFTGVLPLLRRTFASFEPGVRRTLGELAARGPSGSGRATRPAAGPPGFATTLDERRADAVLPLLHLILHRTTAVPGAPSTLVTPGTEVSP